MKKIVALIVAILVPGCWWFASKAKPITGSGNSTVVIKEIMPANELKVCGSGKVLFIQGEPASLAISADDNLISHINVDSNNKSLSISIDNGVRLAPIVPLIYTVTLPELKEIDLQGAIEFNADKLEGNKVFFDLQGSSRVDAHLNAKQLKVEAMGACIINFEGNIIKQKVELQGASHYNAGQLKSQKCALNLSGATRATVQVAKALDVIADGAAFVAYMGNPRVKEKLQGSASVNKVG